MQHLAVFSGSVIRGAGRGRTLGFPTANIDIERWDQLETKRLGVYAARVDISGQCSYLAVANIGKRPTFNSTEKISFELHLLDFEGDLYGKKLNVTLVYFLREEKAFPHIDLLKSQIEQDISTAREYNAHNKVIS